MVILLTVSCGFTFTASDNSSFSSADSTTAAVSLVVAGMDTVTKLSLSLIVVAAAVSFVAVFTSPFSSLTPS